MFAIVRIGDTSLDFLESEAEIHPQHYAFLVNESEFDETFQRIRARGLSLWADPSQRKQGQINTWDGGRGVYWNDPNGHLLEIITRHAARLRTGAHLSRATERRHLRRLTDCPMLKR